MRLLICTQKVAADDDVLGFMHGWISAFARECESVAVVCLEEREHRLPDTVRVFSLGKESVSLNTTIYRSVLQKIRYAVRFLSQIWKLRGRYDAVLVHMNPEYMMLGGLWWRLAGISSGLWYNHKMGGLRALLGIALARKVFYTSPQAFAARFKKASRMPAGIDTEQFKPGASKREPRSILSLGRIDPVKKIEVLIEALRMLADRGVLFTARFYGNPTTEDRSYFERMQKAAEGLAKRRMLRWLPAVPNIRAAAVYNEHGVFVNATPMGSFDKSVLEAMACEVPVLSCNPSFQGLLPEELLFQEGNSAELADKLEALFSRPEEELRVLGRKLRESVIHEQSLALLVPRMLTALKTT
ncbi:MAG TPA: glycosyltransferase family 4 protein [Candidatus Paceibacterota bacterium]